MAAFALQSSAGDDDSEDIGLVASVRDGDERAFEILYERYRRRVFAYVLSMVGDYGRAEDVTQEVFISALRRMRSTTRPIIFKPWVYEIAKNACIDAYRRSRRGEEVSFDATEHIAASETAGLASPAAEPEAAAEVKQRLEHLRRAFGGLSASHHEILVLRELEGLSYREIGERMGLTRPSVESTLFRARRRLTQEYDELESGRRCQRMQSIIAAVTAGGLSQRERRRLASHLGVCPACRREARLAGLDAVSARGALNRVASLVPLPPFLLRRISAGGSSRVGAHTGELTHAAANLGPMLEPAGAVSTKALAIVVSLAVAGASASVASNQSVSPVPRAAAPGAQPARRTPQPSGASKRARDAAAAARSVASGGPAGAAGPAGHARTSTADGPSAGSPSSPSLSPSGSPAAGSPAAGPSVGAGSTGAPPAPAASPAGSVLPLLAGATAAPLGGLPPPATRRPAASGGTTTPLRPLAGTIPALLSTLGSDEIGTLTAPLARTLGSSTSATQAAGGLLGALGGG